VSHTSNGVKVSEYAQRARCGRTNVEVLKSARAANPKSITFSVDSSCVYPLNTCLADAKPLTSVVENIMFSGFRSRWIMPLECMYCGRVRRIPSKLYMGVPVLHAASRVLQL
jgi:hypothetical protein